MTIVGAAAVLIGLVPRLVYPRFYYAGDMLESFIPSWHRIGTALRAGEWLTVNPDAWIGGNYAGEAAYGLYNPVNLANYVLVTFFDDLSVAAAVVMVEFLALFAVATYLLAREYGARRGPAILAALTIPFSGFTLYYEAGGWPSGMMAVAWVTLFWWSALRLSRGRARPVVTFLIGALTISMGNPYAALGAAIVLAGIGIPLLFERRLRQFATLAITGICAGTAALVTYLPLFLSVDVTTRADSSGITNDTFLQPHISDMLGMSNPIFLPVIRTFGGAIEVNPSVYLAWFILPLLPWLPWHRIRTLFASPRFRREHGRPLISLAVIAGFYFLFTFGPSNIGMFRWPIRLIEYLYLAIVVALALALSLGLARDHARRRAATSAGLIFLGFYLGFSSKPESTTKHFAAAVLIAALTWAALAVWRRWRLTGLVAALIAGTVLVTALQAFAFSYDKDTTASADPARISVLNAPADEYQGTVLQLARRELTPASAITDGKILFGNEVMATSVDGSVNAYTGIGFTEFQTALCLDYRGAVCPGLYWALWQPVNDEIPITLADYLRVDTVIIQHELVPAVATDAAPAGWHLVEQDPGRTVWSRNNPLPLPGRVSFASPGVSVQDGTANSSSETVRTSGDGGSVTFARLAWPGYKATIDGRSVDAAAGWHGLLKVDVPAGDHELTVHFTPPGQRLSIAAFGMAAMVIMALTVVDEVRRRRLRRE